MKVPTKLKIRRIGNSQGVLLPKDVILRWGVGLGDHLLLDEHGIVPPPKKNRQVALDEFKRRISLELMARFSLDDIRRISRENLARWKSQGTWGKVYDEWSAILEGSDDALVKTIIGHDERSDRLRQSTPYVGLLPKDIVESLREKV
jgi:antitoxin component of MazEF toxin-antitoxin module